MIGVKRLGVPGENGLRDRVERRFQFRVVFVKVPGIVALPAQGGDLRRGAAEDEDVFAPDLLHDFDVGAVQGADGQRAVEGQLHVAGARGLHAGRGDLLGEIGGGNDLLGLGDAVVGQKNHPQPPPDVRVVR